MTMFSAKPKFNLAEFLATPSPAGKGRARSARNFKANSQPAVKPEEAAKPETEKKDE